MKPVGLRSRLWNRLGSASSSLLPFLLRLSTPGIVAREPPKGTKNHSSGEIFVQPRLPPLVPCPHAYSNKCRPLLVAQAGNPLPRVHRPPPGTASPVVPSPSRPAPRPSRASNLLPARLAPPAAPSPLPRSPPVPSSRKRATTSWSTTRASCTRSRSRRSSWAARVMIRSRSLGSSALCPRAFLGK